MVPWLVFPKNRTKAKIYMFYSFDFGLLGCSMALAEWVWNWACVGEAIGCLVMGTDHSGLQRPICRFSHLGTDGRTCASLLSERAGAVVGWQWVGACSLPKWTVDSCPLEPLTNRQGEASLEVTNRLLAWRRDLEAPLHQHAMVVEPWPTWQQTDHTR